MTAREQLERILYILPAAHREGGVRLDELARALQVDVKTVVRDLGQVTSREFYHPAGTVEAFTAIVEPERVTLWTSGVFDRPTRLNAGEALALQLGLRVLAAEREDPDRADLLALAERLERELSVPEAPTVHVQRDAQVRERRDYAFESEEVTPHDVEYEPADEFMLNVGDDALRARFTDAIEEGRLCRLLYLKPASREPATRTVAPLHLVYDGGRWYVLAYDVDRRATRLFRLDRVLDAVVLDEPAPDIDVETSLTAMRENAAAYIADQEIEVTVRYAADVSRWVSERTGAAPDADGSVTLTHHVADPQWIVQHVLQYGGSAWIEAPEDMRRRVADAASALTA